VRTRIEASPKSATGDRPIGITWRLEHAIAGALSDSPEHWTFEEKLGSMAISSSAGSTARPLLV